jgi:hypothetical protein
MTTSLVREIFGGGGGEPMFILNLIKTVGNLGFPR